MAKLHVFGGEATENMQFRLYLPAPWGAGSGVGGNHGKLWYYPPPQKYNCGNFSSFLGEGGDAAKLRTGDGEIY